MRFEVIILGSNGAVPTPERHASAQLLRSEATDLLIDCAEGTQLQLQAAGVGLGRTDTILISHLHGDHYFGLPGLITSLSLLGRIMPLRIISPPGLRAKLTPLLELDRWRLPFPLTFEEHTATDYSLLTSSGELDIYSFPLRHRIPTNGYLIRERDREPNIRKDQLTAHGIPWQAIPAIKQGGDHRLPSGEVIAHAQLVAPAAAPRSYAYCSDTVYFPELADYVRGVDLLYHEATFLEDMTEEAAKKGHATAKQAAQVAVDAGAKELLLGHFSARYRDVVEHEREARQVFANSTAARDLYHFAVLYAGRQEAPA
ncbi:Ribonuclease BN [Neolewinella maritima]|uniref:Ribonuclease Z n=1 Tax=Neolewinella maritima TaxID=1383882 RepID=A0ABN8FCH9_9BACT|nr:ribonuclease Z [Neolewinella maritima]CAH1002065.1 Ribonuclease BN [Neolewinella maritima]